MKKYVIIAVKNYDAFEEVLPATEKEEAIQKTISTWEALSKHDKKHHEEYYLVYAPTDDEGNPDCYGSNAQLVYTIK